MGKGFGDKGKSKGKGKLGPFFGERHNCGTKGHPQQLHSHKNQKEKEKG